MNESKLSKSALSVGTAISSDRDNYIIEAVLGAGGFGITYKVLRLSDHKEMAMKEFFPDLMCERGKDETISFLRTNSDEIENGINNFITEAERLKKQNISHPNIVAVDEVFKANNTAYYTMEYIEGNTLRQYVKSNKGEPLSIEQTLSVMRPVLQAVRELHKNKITHLDIKHDNILLIFEDDGSIRPVLIDFGQSKHYDKKGKATSKLTNAGCSEGFAPPEQYIGLTQFTPEADIYALCATILYLLSGKQPLKSSDMSASRIEMMLGSSVPQKIRNAIISGMRQDKNDRTKSVLDLALQLGIDITEYDHEGNVTRLLNLYDKKDKKKKTFQTEKVNIKRDHSFPSVFTRIKKIAFRTVAVILILFVAFVIYALAFYPDSPEEDEAQVEEQLPDEAAEDVKLDPAMQQIVDDGSSQSDNNIDNQQQTVVKEEAKTNLIDSKAENKVEQKTKSNKAIEQETNKKTEKQHSSKEIASQPKKENYGAKAEQALSSRNYSAADSYARRAISSGDGASQGQSVINKLKALGYYDDKKAPD